MPTFKISAITTAFMFLGIFADSCEAGPLLDWLRGRRAVTQYHLNTFRQNTFYRGPVAQAQSYAQMPGTCTTTCPKTCYQTVNRVVANYVPYTAFRTEWYRVPVTYYRPVTSTNPQTGCISTCMRPCTYYQMQARRVPYTTYQTVYRTVQHRIPYTVYETSYGSSCNSCGTGNACTSCGVNPSQGIVQNSAPYGLNTQGQFNMPANSVPALNPGEIKQDMSLQKPADDVPKPEADPETNKDNTSNSSHSQPNLNVPANPAPVVDDSNRTASLIRGKWNYSPVRSAGYVTSVNNSNAPSQVSGFSNSSKPSGSAFRSSGWKSVGK